MTEAEWLACDDPTRMLEFLRDKVSDRKLRLFAVACYRRIWDLLTDEPSQPSRSAVEVAERLADGLASDEERLAFRQLPSQTSADAATRAALARYAVAMEATTMLPEGATAERSRAAGKAAMATERIAQGLLLRDIVGNPFRPIMMADAWRPNTVVTIAEAAYTDRAFDRLPILADALEDAGCTDRAVLDHCRQPGEHARGCWVVDLVLGKK